MNIGDVYRMIEQVRAVTAQLGTLPPPGVMLNAGIRLARNAVVSEVRSRPIPPRYLERFVTAGYTEEQCRAFYDAAWEDGTYD